MDIKNTGAGKNIFFDACKNAVHFPREKTFTYCRNWYAITKAFGSYSTVYLGVLAEAVAVMSDDSESQQKLKKLLQASAMIVMDDLGLNRGAEDGVSGPIHYDLFMSQFTKEEHNTIASIVIEIETKALCKLICSNFESAVGGLANFCVIEAIAYTIVETQQVLLGPSIYTTLHLSLETEHADESATMYEEYKSLPGMEELDSRIETLINAFHEFWKKMYCITFA